MDYETLAVISALSDNVTVRRLDNNKIVVIQHPKASAAIALHGGHVLSFKPVGGQETIWMSKQAIHDGKSALRGGVPICWPWFGRIGSPAHGFARNSEWQIAQHRENDHGVIVSLSLSDSPATRAIWPHQFELRLNVEITEQLKISLEIHNTDDHAWNFSGALHTYLNVADIHQTKITGMGSHYLDSLQQGKLCLGGEELQLTDTIDRVYTDPDAMIQVEDKQHQRTLSVTNSGHNSAVLWNPWQQGAESMGDMNDDGYLSMICVESTVHANHLDHGIELQSGESHTLATTISLS
ncbi:D-hexose-6-phosphate mutarotase [Vibrio hippocampi]|uniref:Putative glucose-6-phosphate 1-epimerase n=1 Tax=Vibrio hippocampi TaxID=654686 RepID=A0ABM8ZIB3_9VIBR|nr:D-hexose-6-phosphate mutarotase [Vibrio hippocampi]CAH0526549.1 Putative glucose-6-phosphate 1-epimerase [Vibrio hippocampi]